MHDYSTSLSALNDPATSTDELLEIARRFPLLRGAVANHPNISAEALGWMEQKGWTVLHGATDDRPAVGPAPKAAHPVQETFKVASSAMTKFWAGSLVLAAVAVLGLSAAVNLDPTDMKKSGTGRRQVFSDVLARFVNWYTGLAKPWPRVILVAVCVTVATLLVIKAVRWWRDSAAAVLVVGPDTMSWTSQGKTQIFVFDQFKSLRVVERISEDAFASWSGYQFFLAFIPVDPGRREWRSLRIPESRSFPEGEYWHAFWLKQTTFPRGTEPPADVDPQRLSTALSVDAPELFAGHSKEKVHTEGGQKV